MGEKTPEEFFTSEKPDAGHLNIFYCHVDIHVKKQMRINMEPSKKKGTFIGYSEFSKAYRIFVPRERHNEVSRDVTFHEYDPFEHSKELHCDSK